MLRHHLVFRRCLMVVVAGLGVFAEGTFAEAAKPIGRFLEVKGDVRVLDVSGKPRPAEVFGSVYADESLGLSADASVVISFRSGACERISEVATATLKESGVEPITAAKPLKLPPKAKKLIGESLVELDKNTGGVTVTRSAVPVRPPTIDVSPIVGSTVLTSKPMFAWPVRKDAKSYELILKGARGDKRLWGTDTKANRAEYSGSEKLKEDKEYRWEVFVTLAEGKVEPLCNGSFRIGTTETREAAAGLVELADDSEPPLVALAAIRLEELGLFAEAIQQYERLIKLAPRRAEFPAALSELYDKAGRTAEAAKSRELAKQLGFSFATKTAPNAKPAGQE